MTLYGLAPSARSQALEVENAFPELSFAEPVDLQHAADGSDRLFVVEMRGVVRVFPNRRDATQAPVFLDISSRVLFNSRFGLLGLAFHPDYPTNGQFYVHYIADAPARSVIARFTVSVADSNQADAASELILLELEQPDITHNGGQLAFGPDGYLYIGFGDGGPVGGSPDPDNHGQRRDTFHGAMLRLDVDNPSGGRNYGIPGDNPFVGNSEGWLEEVWAWGFRNPWRFSFDPATGWLWAGDNGENSWEEINVVERAANYGWRIMEGNVCFVPGPQCDTTGLTLPVWVYGGNAQRRSVIGGHVYRGTHNPEIVGRYVYGDFLRGTIWALQYDGMAPTDNVELATGQWGLATFGVDEQQELYFCNQTGGQVLRFKPTNTPVDSRTWTDVKRRFR